jgi:hypothetical protein
MIVRPDVSDDVHVLCIIRERRTATTASVALVAVTSSAANMQTTHISTRPLRLKRDQEPPYLACRARTIFARLIAAQPGETALESFADGELSVSGATVLRRR